MTQTLPTITVNKSFVSVFEVQAFPMAARGGMDLTDRIDALNLRLRESAPGYQSDWHVAGDPTLIIIQAGTLRISLRDQSFCDFGAGDAFIARDYLPQGVDFDPDVHGHQATVLGAVRLKAVHIKLARQES
jgi:hypothetical protein